jgi:hypothetical protein
VITTPLDAFISLYRSKVHAPASRPKPDADGKRDTKRGAVSTPPDEFASCRAESALVYVPSLGCELWIASDQVESEQFRAELAAEDDGRAVIVADEVVKLRGQPRGLVDATVRALVAFSGAVLRYAGGSQPRDISTEKSTPAITTDGWAPADHALVEWFIEGYAAGRLPTRPFQRSPAARIANPTKWYGRLVEDIRAGRCGPRAASLVAELRRLREITEGNEQHREEEESYRPRTRRRPRRRRPFPATTSAGSHGSSGRSPQPPTATTSSTSASTSSRGSARRRSAAL